MSDQAAPAMSDPEYFRLAGEHAMNMGLPKSHKFKIVDGSRRRFGDRTPRPALDVKLVENTK